jgi:peptide/nickel transport system substrate-binding protein
MSKRKLNALALMAGVSIVALSGAARAQGAYECKRMGGEFVYGLEAKVATLDQHVTNAGVVRNITMGMFESLMTRDENMAPMLGLAESVNESPDGLAYTFKLRDGVKFHNGKTMTSDDVIASLERFQRIGIDKNILGPVDKMEAPDASTVVLRLKDRLSTFLETFSIFTSPIVIVPKENASAPANQLPPVGTGPFQMLENVADSYIKLKRFDGYKLDTRYTGTSGFGGYKKVCVDTVNFRMMVEPGARVAALETGEVHAVEDVPTPAQKRLKTNQNIRLMPLDNFWLHITYPNLSFPPTDNLKFRQAVQAVLDMEEIMEASSDGLFRLGHAFQFESSAYYSDVGKSLYNQKDKNKAKRLLQEAGYKGEKVVLLTNREYAAMYNASVVMMEQLKSVGINAELLTLDWPAALTMSQKSDQGWNFFYTGWTTVTAQGGLQSLRFLADPNNVHKPKDNKSDPVFMQHFLEGVRGQTLDSRKASFAKAQERVYDQVMAIPFGILPKVTGVRANIDGFKPFFIGRAWNVSIMN